MLIKQLTAFFLSFVLIFISTPSFAADPNDFRKPNQWQRERTINDAVNKSTVKVEAQKTYPVSTLDQNGKPIKQMRNAKSTVKVAANVNKVGKTIFKRSPASAITLAMTNLLGRAVDWVLDPENNRIKYKDKDGGNPTGKFCFDDVCGSDLHETAIRYFHHKRKPYQNNGSEVTYHNVTVVNINPSNWQEKMTSGGDRFSIKVFTTYDQMREGRIVNDIKLNWNFSGYAHPADDAGQPVDWQYEHIDAVSSQMIADANDGQAPSMQVMTDAALDALEAGDLDSSLDAASDIPQPDPQEITQTQYDNPDYPEAGSGTGPETPTDPENPFELPPFCSWATKVCSFIDWVQAEPPNDTEIELPEPDAQEVDTDIDFGGQCPDDAGFTMNIFGNDVEFVMMPFSKFCPLLDTYIKPVLVVLGSFMAVTIVGGRRDG